ncbi:MAG: RNA-binding S4 domain-containing protein [Neptuniibacter sp.]
MSKTIKQIIINKEPVELFKILKFEGLTSTGGEAKLLIGDGQVMVNHEVETRKSRKMVSGDTLKFAGEVYKLKFEPEVDLD